MRRRDTIPFNRPTLVGHELDYVREAITLGHASSGGTFSKRCADLLREEMDGAASVLLTTSCTDALEMCGLLLEIRPGDVVVVPSFTFVSTALAFVRAGARLRFADIDRTTLGLDPSSVAALIDDRVRAVVTVHYAGVGCEVRGLLDVLPDGVDLIEDNAHGLFGSVGGRTLGSFGRFSTLSFHETKNFSCGEGGALVVNREVDVERAQNLLDKGTNRRAFMLGQTDKYTWVDTGSSFGLSDLLAAYLFAQLERRDEIMARRRAVWRTYDEQLRLVEDETYLELMRIPEDRDCSWHMYYVLVPTPHHRRELIEYLDSCGVNATFHYVPLHSAPAAERFTDRETECPVTDEISGRLVRLPFHTALEPHAQACVSQLIGDWARSRIPR